MHGASLGVYLALAGFALAALGGFAALAVHRMAVRLLVPVLALLMVSSAVLVWLQPDGAGPVGLLIAVGIAARVIPGRTSIVLLTACLAFLLVAESVNQDRRHQGTLELLVNALPLAAIYMIVLFGRRIRLQEAQTERLLIELEETRGAELRAAALAERQRLARDMHDVLAHSLSGLLLQLEGARLLALSNPADERLAGTIDRAHELARNGLEEARRAIGMLRDDELPGPDRLAALTGGLPGRHRRPVPLHRGRAAAASGSQLVQLVQQFPQRIAGGDGLAVLLGYPGLPGPEPARSDDHVRVSSAELQQPSHLIGLIRHQAQARRPCIAAAHRTASAEHLVTSRARCLSVTTSTERRTGP